MIREFLNKMRKPKADKQAPPASAKKKTAKQKTP